MSTQCNVCNASAKLNFDGSVYRVECVRCGSFFMGDVAALEVANWPPQQRYNLSGWLRENPGFRILAANLRTLSTLRTPSPAEKANKLLISLARDYRKPGCRIKVFDSFSEGTDVSTKETIYTGSGRPDMISKAWAQDDEELIFVVVQYMQRAKRFLSGSGRGEFFITPEGWAQVESMAQRNVESTIGFVAMWFDKQMDDVYLVLHKAIEDAGYEPLRIDKKEHINRIDDEIIGAIRKSRFLVADFTRQRGGVYYEAGFAAGLGIPVIWLCREDDVSNLHFDTRQYSHILWNPEELQQLRVALQRRIEATIGAGPKGSV